MIVPKIMFIALLTAIGVLLTLICVLLGIITLQEIYDQYRVLKERIRNAK